MTHNGTPRPVTPPLMLRPYEKQRAIAKLQSAGYRIDKAATVPEVARLIGKATWQTLSKNESEKYAMIRRYIKREEPKLNIPAYEWHEYRPDEAMQRALERAADPYRRELGDGR